MNVRKPAVDKTPTVVEVHDPSKLPGRLKLIGGSMSDDWNNIIANQTVSALWLAIPMTSKSKSSAMHRSML